MTPTHVNTDPEKLFILATQHHQNNELKDACDLYFKLLVKFPHSPLINYNLGLALYEQGKYEESFKRYTLALELTPDDNDILYNLALCTKKLGDFDNTIRLYKKILRNEPDDVDSLYNLGCCYNDMGDNVKAISTFKKVIKLFPDHQSAINNLAFIYHKGGDLKNGIKFYSLLLRLNPDHQSAKHMLASLKGETPKIAPPEYIEKIFDDYSGHYEESLVNKLEYNVPTLMREHFCDFLPNSQKIFHTLDLGCGTGLAGEAFSDLCSSLTGVDISQKMIDIAATKKIYNSLTADGIENFLNEHTSSYELFLATDVFTYIGELETIFISLYQIAKPDTFFCFSTEKSSGDTFKLRNTGRFAHSLSYIERLSRDTGWEILHHFDINLRKEKGKWIKGMLYFLKKDNPPSKDNNSGKRKISQDSAQE